MSAEKAKSVTVDSSGAVKAHIDVQANWHPHGPSGEFIGGQLVLDAAANLAGEEWRTTLAAIPVLTIEGTSIEPAYSVNPEDALVVTPATGQLALSSGPPLCSIATVTRVVGNDLVYVVTDDDGPAVFTPDKISGYKGEPLKQLGIREGARIDVTLDDDHRSVIAVETKRRA
jgi:hypothetical protein